jgi:hypothetical protein
MNTTQILNHIDEEIAQLQQVKALPIGAPTERGPRRPAPQPSKSRPSAKKRAMSADGRSAHRHRSTSPLVRKPGRRPKANERINILQRTTCHWGALLSIYRTESLFPYYADPKGIDLSAQWSGV